MVEPIDDFERELRGQLTAREAPEGFADRVMARVAVRDKVQERRRWFRQPVWRQAKDYVGNPLPPLLDPLALHPGPPAPPGCCPQ